MTNRIEMGGTEKSSPGQLMSEIDGATQGMTVAEKSALIWAIIGALRISAHLENKPFDTGDTFFALAFMSDANLQHIAKLARV